MVPGSKLVREDVVLIIVDMQEKLFPAVVRKEEIFKNLAKLIEFCQIIELPIMITEQYPKGLGQTINEVRDCLKMYHPIEKVNFSCFGVSGFVEKLETLGKKTLIVSGIETHVCIFQTVRDALANGYMVHVLADATSSRTEANHNIGIERMRELGATISSTEMFIFEILEKAGTDEFKTVAPLLK